MVPEKVLIGILIFIASLLQGVFDFTFMLIALPLLSLFLSVKVAVPLLSFFLALLSGILAFRFRSKFDLKDVMPLLSCALIGIPLGILFLIEFSDKFIKTTLGLPLIGYSVYSLFMRKIPSRLPRWTGCIAGFSAGARAVPSILPAPQVIQPAQVTPARSRRYSSVRPWQQGVRLPQNP